MGAVPGVALGVALGVAQGRGWRGCLAGPAWPLIRHDPIPEQLTGYLHIADALIIYAVHQSREERSRPVAQKIQTLFIDDLDGSEAAGTVRFGLDGTEYEIDLTTEHADALRKSLAPYVAAARRNSSTLRPARPRRRSPASGVDNTEVRAWARSQGMDVKDRGRIPAELVVKFKAASDS